MCRGGQDEKRYTRAGSIIAVLVAYGLDALGEPPAAWHPVVWYGNMIRRLEYYAPRHHRTQLVYGAVMPGVALTVVLSVTLLLQKMVCCCLDCCVQRWRIPVSAVLYGVLMGGALKPFFALHMLADAGKAGSIADFPAQPDLIILPGTKNTLFDLSWLWQCGLAQHIRQCVKAGSAVLGICGGYQMLGERVSDLAGIESQAGSVEPGLHLLRVETFFTVLDEKTTQLSQARIRSSSARGLFAYVGTQNMQVYQIHLGRTVLIHQESSVTALFSLAAVPEPDGWLSADGWCAGCYLHGLFENDAFRHGIVTSLAERRSLAVDRTKFVPFNRQTEYDKLASVLRSSLDIAHLKTVCDLEMR